MRIPIQIVTLCLALCLPLRAATLQDFGYENMKVNGEVAKGNRPLLVILANFAGANTFANVLGYYDNFVFNLFAQPGVNNYFLEVSDGRFFWSRGGTVATTLPSSMLFTNFIAGMPQGAPLDQLYASNIIHRVMTNGIFNFATYDDDNNGTVSQHELQILIISNDGDWSGANRWAGNIRPPGSAVTVSAGKVALVNHRTGLSTFCHELSHSLGPTDLYGSSCLSDHVTLMSCTLNGPDNHERYHMDPWHKLQLGWVEPRIVAWPSGGYAEVPAAQTIDATTPLLLYDPAVGTAEFFMLEYRARDLVGGGLNDAHVSGNGLAIWRVKQDGNKNPVLVPRLDAGPLPAQNGWRFCGKCQGLHHIGADWRNPVLRPCPEGGMHSVNNSAGYLVVMNIATAPGQHGWRWCQKCSSMFFGPGQASSRCIVGGTHDGSASGNYSFVMNDATAPGQENWKWCVKCQSLFHGSGTAISDCPADGRRHDGTQSGDYSVLLEGEEYVVWTEGAPNFTRGGNTLWTGGSVTPYLRRLDGSETRLRLHVRPFVTGAASIIVEWWHEVDYWVAYNIFPFLELGTFQFPFDTLGEAATAAPFGALVSIKPGNGNESVRVTKRLRLQAWNGPVSIGKP